MDKTKLDHLDEAIRHSIEEECSNRNSRTNWFLVLQVALAGGLIQVCSNDFSEQYRWIFVIIIGIAGFLISVSFAFAAWRSEKAVDMLINKCAGLMPYKFIPKLFLVCWLLLLLFVVIYNHDKVICG